jgi:hypothetical protein
VGTILEYEPEKSDTVEATAVADGWDTKGERKREFMVRWLFSWEFVRYMRYMGRRRRGVYAKHWVKNQALKEEGKPVGELRQYSRSYHSF